MKKEHKTYEIFVQHDSEGNLINNSGSISILEDGTPDITDYAIFVMAESGELYLSKNRKVGEFHHSSFLAGKPVAAAGEMIIKKGIIIEINNASGHYMPSLDFVKKNILKELDSRHYFISGDTREGNIKFISEF